MLVNASYHDHQEYKGFMGGDLEHFQDKGEEDENVKSLRQRQQRQRR